MQTAQSSATLTQSAGSEDVSPAWSRDGEHIAFASDATGDFEIWIMNSDGGGRSNLSNSPAHEREPAWASDGTHIAFESDRDGNSELYVMEVDGSNQTRLTDSLEDDFQSAWSPDGNHIAFMRRGDIWVMNSDGTDAANITQNGSFDERPDWADEFCVVRLGLVDRVVRSGQELEIMVRVEHNRAVTVTVPLVVWIEAEDGALVVERKSLPQRMERGDSKDVRVMLPIPLKLQPGMYNVVVGVKGMLHNVAWAVEPFKVVE